MVLALALAAAQPAPAPPPPSPLEAREKLRHCAAEWTRLKKSGAAAGKLWRDFWPACSKA